MIGRFSNLGDYRGLFSFKDFAVCLGGGALALVAWVLGESGWGFWAGAFALAAVAINGAPIVVEAAKGVMERRVNVDELVSIAIVASILQGELLTAAVVSFIMTLGALVEEAVSDGARRSIEALAKLAPEEATVVGPDGAERVVSVAEVRAGDLVMVRPGERIPVDAVIEAGTTAVDESALTGESLPRERAPGDTILAGTLNYTGRVTARATKVGEDSTFGKVVKLVVAAEAGKPRAGRIVDNYAKYFTPLVLACAALAWMLSGDADRAVAVLVAGCPCALLMAAPTATVAAIGRAAKRGILIKGGQYLEEVGRADVALFDKTGTLTLGRPVVEAVIPADGIDEAEVLGCAACLERHCNHPLAAAVLDAAKAAGVEARLADSLTAEAGLGLRGELDGEVVEVGSPEMMGGAAALPPRLADCLGAMCARGATGLVVRKGGAVIGLLAVSDTVKDEAAAAVAGLRGLGLATVGILSGDHDKAVSTLAGRIGVSDVWSGLKPQDKLDILADFQNRGRRVLFVGDGVNDAPALARANVGVAMGAAGSDVALETADIALANDDLGRLPFLVYLGRRMTTMIAVNIGLGLFFNSVAILGSGYGLLSPVAAALFHNIGSIVVVLSSASLALTAEPAVAAAKR